MGWGWTGSGLGTERERAADGRGVGWGTERERAADRRGVGWGQKVSGMGTEGVWDGDGTGVD